MADEDPIARDSRHFAEGKVAYATLDAVSALDRKIDKISGSVDRLTAWFQGTTSPTGVQELGVLAKVQWLWGIRVAVIALIGAIAIATATNASLNVIDHVTGNVPIAPTSTHR